MKLWGTKQLAHICCLLCIISVCGAAGFSAEARAAAKKVYVKPSSEVAVRVGKGTEFKIVALVKDGSVVEMLEEDEFYAKVRLPNNREGWMLTRFLSEDPPLDELVASLKRENEQIQQKEADAEQELEALSSALNQTKAALTMVSAERDKVAKDLADLQAATTDVIKIKTELEETKNTHTQLSQQLAVMKEENNNLKKDKKLNWFLAGGGVLLLGILLGRMPGPTRKRKSSLM